MRIDGAQVLRGLPAALLLRAGGGRSGTSRVSFRDSSSLLFPLHGSGMFYILQLKD